MGDNGFTQLLEKKKQAIEKNSVASKRRLGRWRMALGELGMKLTKWLDLPVKKHVVTLSRSPKEIIEELLGPYSVQKWTVTIGDRRVVFDPIATYVVGSYGRVDVIGPAASFKLIREKDDGHWSLVDPSDARLAVPLTKEIFEKILLAAIG
jgi:hypothetical protein